jgi:hypothetical protein
MKKLLFAAILSLAGVGLGTGQAKAWLFCHHCCHGSATICVRPYNAFTPSVFGCITADGCFPLCGSQCPPPPPPPWMFGGPMGGGCCGPSLGCAMDGGTSHVVAPGAPVTTSPTVLPQGAVPTLQGPAPAQMPVGPAGAQAYPTGIQAAGYRTYVPTGMYQGYAPLPWMQPPSYPAAWSPNGR